MENTEAEIKAPRNLSGMYFRVKRDDGFESICFEDLTSAEQDEILLTKNIDFIKGIAKGMANSLREIGDTFDIGKD